MLAMLFIYGCAKHEQAPPPPPKVTVAKPVAREVTDYLELSGNTQPVNTVQLVARVSGYLDKVLFQDGQAVKKGQLLFEIQQESYLAGLQQAEGQVLAQKAQLEYAQNQLNRYAKLLPEKAASKADVDNWQFQRDSAKANLETAEANLRQAKLNLGYTKISAPFEGRIDRRLQDPGNFVGSGANNTVLAQLTQTEPIYIYFNISEADLARLTAGRQELPGQSGSQKKVLYAGMMKDTDFPHKGTIDFAATTITSTTGTLLMRGVFANPKGRILPGLFARVRVPMEKRDSLLVPTAAISSDQQGSYVVIVDDKNVAARRPVKTGALVDTLTVILEGLDGTEWIVTAGILKAVPGRPVTPERENNAAAANVPSGSAPSGAAK